MQITIQDHDTVIRGLVTEMQIRDSERVAAEQNLEAARKTIEALDETIRNQREDFNLLASVCAKRQDQLEEIRLVATGQSKGVLHDDLRWSQALQEVINTQDQKGFQIWELKAQLAAKKNRAKR